MIRARWLLPVFILALLTCRRTWMPDTPQPPSGPQYGYISQDYEYSALGEYEPGHLVGFRFSWGDGDTSSWTDSLPSADTFRLAHAWSDTGTYEVRVQARTTDDRRTDWSSALNVNIDNRAGDARIAGPEFCYVDSVCTLSIWADGPYWDSLAFRLNIGGAWEEWTPFVAYGETAKVYHVFTQPETAYVYAIAKDKRNREWMTGGHLTIATDYTPGRVLWCNPEAFVWHLGCPAVDEDGTIYTGGYGVAAVNPDGSNRWRYDERTWCSAVLGTNGLLHVTGEWNDARGLIALNRSTGEVVWTYEMSTVPYTTPALGPDGTIYLGAGEDSIIALHPDGRLKWGIRMPTIVCSAPAVGPDGTIYVASFWDSLYALYPDGSVKWARELRVYVYFAMAIGADGTLCIAGPGDNLTALNPDGSERWRCRVEDEVWSTPVIGPDGTIYINSGHTCYAVNPNGTIKWAFDVGDHDYVATCAPAVAADGTIVFGTDKGYVYALDADGRVRWRSALNDQIYTAATIGTDGTIYIDTDDGKLYAFEGTAPLANSPWPKFQRDLGNTGRAGP